MVPCPKCGTGLILKPKGWLNWLRRAFHKPYSGIVWCSSCKCEDKPQLPLGDPMWLPLTAVAVAGVGLYFIMKRRWQRLGRRPIPPLGIP